MTDPQQLAALEHRIISVTSLAKSGRHMGAIGEAVALSRQFPLSRHFYTMLFTLLKWHDDQALAHEWAKRACVVFPESAEPYAILDRIAFERGAYVKQLSLAVWQIVLADASRYQDLQNHLLAAAINVYGVGLAKNAGLTEHPCFSFVETFTEERMGERDPDGDLQAIAQGNIELPRLSTKRLQHLLSGDVETSKKLFEAYEEKRGSAPPMSPIVRKKFQNIGAPIQDVYYPYSVHFESVNACNAACVMCPVSSTARKVNRMHEDLFYKMVDEVSTWPIDASIGLHGVGEPLLHKDIAKRVEYVR